jgi:hypothetical protein
MASRMFAKGFFLGGALRPATGEPRAGTSSVRINATGYFIFPTLPEFKNSSRP